MRLAMLLPTAPPAVTPIVPWHSLAGNQASLPAVEGSSMLRTRQGFACVVGGAEGTLYLEYWTVLRLAELATPFKCPGDCC